MKPFKPPVAALAGGQHPLDWSSQQQGVIADLRDPEFREEFGVRHTSWIGPQLRAVREYRGLSQGDLAKLTDTQQSAISRAESVDYGRWSLNKLQQTAKVLGCWVEIRLRSFGELVKDLPHKNRQGLLVSGFEDDPILNQDLPPLPDAEDEHLRNVQVEIRRWMVAHHQDKDLAAKCVDQLKRWLLGWDLPGVAEEEDSSLLIADALSTPGWSGRRYRCWDRATADLLAELTFSNDEMRLASGLFTLCERLPNARTFEPHLERVFLKLKDRSIGLTVVAERHFIEAVKNNQTGEVFLELWLSAVQAPNADVPQFIPLSEADLEDGLEGLLRIPRLLSERRTVIVVSWVAAQIFLRYHGKRGRSQSPAQARELYDHYLNLLKEFYSGLEGLNQRPILTALLAYQLIIQHGCWSGFQREAFYDIFLAGQTQPEIREILLAARTAPIILDDGEPDHGNSVMLEIARLVDSRRPDESPSVSGEVETSLFDMLDPRQITSVTRWRMGEVFEEVSRDNMLAKINVSLSPTLQ